MKVTPTSTTTALNLHDLQSLNKIPICPSYGQKLLKDALADIGNINSNLITDQIWCCFNPGEVFSAFLERRVGDKILEHRPKSSFEEYFDSFRVTAIWLFGDGKLSDISELVPALLESNLFDFESHGLFNSIILELW